MPEQNSFIMKKKTVLFLASFLVQSLYYVIKRISLFAVKGKILFDTYPCLVKPLLITFYPNYMVNLSLVQIQLLIR